MSRNMRRALGVATMVGALFVLPAAASAATTFNLTSSGSVAPGTVRQYELEFGNTGADWGTDPGDILVDAHGGTISNVQYNDPAELPTVGTAFPLTVTPDAGNSGKSFVITFDVTLPHYYNAAYEVEASTIGGDFDGAFDSVTIETIAGGPSDIVSSFGAFGPAAGTAGLVDRWVAKGGTGTSTVRFTNQGSGAASHVLVRVSAWGNASVLSPSWGANPAFTPAVTIPATAACVAVSADTCEIPSIAPGATVSFPVNVAGLTHFGEVSLQGEVQDKDDEGANDPDGNSTGTSLKVTDGTISAANVAVSAAPRVVTANGTVVYNVEFANAGPQAITNGVLRITGQSIVAGDFEPGSHVGDPGVTPTIQGPVTFNGVACAALIDRSVMPEKAFADVYDCPIASLAVGARITGAVAAKYATSKPDLWTSLEAEAIIAGYTPTNASPVAGDWVDVNPSKTVDLQVSASSQALVGVDRVADVTVSVKNAGSTKAEAVRVFGASTSGKGQFDAVDMPASCTGVTKPIAAACSLGDIEPGATATIVLPVKAGAKLGLLPISFNANDSGRSTEINIDDNSTALALQIVKANAVPLLGVKIGKPVAQKLAVAAKSGVKTVVNVPGAATVKVDLRVNAKTAKALGIAVKVKKGKKAPLWYVIGASTTKAKAGGNVTTTTKLSAKYKAKVLKAKAKFTAQRMVTVVSTDRKNAGASSLTTQNLAFTPAKAKKGKK